MPAVLRRNMGITVMENEALKGKIIKISGPVLDVRFKDVKPRTNNLLATPDGIHMEVVAHVSPDVSAA